MKALTPILKSQRCFYLIVVMVCGLVLGVKAQPVANFTANKTSGCSPLTVQFTSTSTGSPTSFDWNLGNSNTSTLQNPSATYVLPGTYTVSLKVTNASGNNTKTQTAFITVFSNPVANFTAVPTSGCVPVPVTFTDASTAGNGILNSWLWDFGNGNTNSTQNPSTTYTGVGIYNVTLSVRDVNGCENSITKNNYINTSNPFTLDFTASGNNNCAVPTTVNFSSVLSPTGSYTYLWKFGDNTTSTLANPSKTYTIRGNYTVELEVTAANGCKKTVTKTNLVQVGGVVADFTYSTTNDCAPTSLSLTSAAQPSPSALTHQWTLNGAQSQSFQNPNYFLADKSNTISLTVSNAAGCSHSITRIITLQDPPTADFTIDKDYFCSAPATVNFTNKSTGGATIYGWNFGNSLGSSATNPSVTYQTDGVFSARLIATRPNGCRDTLFKSIIVDTPHVFIDSRNFKGGCAPYQARFSVLDQSRDPMIKWEWKLNNAVVSTTQDFNYTINTNGVYVFKLTASNSHGCVITVYDTVRVKPKPLFDFVADPLEICFNPGITTLYYLPLDTNKATDVRWKLINPLSTIIPDPGDTTTATLKDTGYYTVVVTASNYGCENTVTKTNFLRLNPAIADFDFKIDLCSTDTVLFTNLSIGKNKILWDFDENGATSTQSPKTTYVFTRAGTHNVKITATDTTTGCVDSKIKPVVIILPPKVSFTPLDTTICLGRALQITDKTVMDPSRTIKQWGYVVTNGMGSSSQNPIFTFTTAGVFGIKLTIKDNKDCLYSFTDSQTVRVYGGSADFSLSSNSGCIPLTVLVNDLSTTDKPIVSRLWKWGTGDSLFTAAASGAYTYTTSPPNQDVGTTLSLTIIDSLGCKYTASKNIKPYQPHAVFTSTILKRCGLDSVTLTGSTSAANINSPGTYRWILPTGTANTSSTRFSMSGDTLVPVTFILLNSMGCADTNTQMISIKANRPKIGFDGYPRDIPCFSQRPTIHLKDTSIIGGSPIISRSWNFGNGNKATIVGKGNDSASLIYLKPGKYTVSLKIVDSLGCKDSLIIPDFVVAGGPIGTYTFTPRRGCTPLDVGFKVTSSNSALFFWDHADGNVDSFMVDTHTYQYTNPRVYYPRLTLVDSSLTCFNGLDAIDSIEVLPLPKPDFTTNLKVICKDGFITLSNTSAPHPSPINMWRWIIDNYDTLNIKQPLPVKMRFPGVYGILLEAADTNGCYASIYKDSILTVNDDTIPPAVPLAKRATVMDNDRVQFEFIPNTESDFAKYIIYSTTNQYTLSTITDSELIEQGLNTLANAYSYQMLAIDVCLNSSAPSETHTTVELKATGMPNSVVLNWTPYHGFDTSKYYQLWRKTPDTDFAPLITLDGSTLSYIDTSINCKQTYFYRIQTIETDSLLQLSWSDTAGAVPVYHNILPTPENIRATVVNNKSVLLEWHLAKHNRTFKYHIYKSEDDGAPVLFKVVNSSDTTLIDVEVNVQEHSYTYTTHLVDACDGQSAPSNIAKTILLSVRMVGNDMLKHDPQLTWNAYKQWDNGVHHYTIDFWNLESGLTEEICRTTDANRFTKHKYINLTQSEYCYLATAFKAGDSSIISESNQACVSTAPRLYAPNVFTINGDNLNDQFWVRGIFIESFTLKIFNRWGELVFESNDINKGWDGTFKGEPCKPDVFVYIAEGLGLKGQRVEITGNVTLMR